MIGMNGLNAYYDQRGEAQHKYFDTSQPLMGVGGDCGCRNGMGTVIETPAWAATATTGTTATVPPATVDDAKKKTAMFIFGGAIVGFGVVVALASIYASRR